MQVKLIVEGGAMKPGPALSQKLGPAGIPINTVIQKINECTMDFNGLKVPIELDVNTKTKTFEIKVFSPPVSELLKKELNIQKGSGTQKKSQAGNISIEQVISVAKTKMQNLLAKDLKSAVRLIVGTCGTLGILIENKNPKEIQTEIAEGKYDKEIKEARTKTSDEKRKALDAFFVDLKAKQEKLLKAEQAAKEAAAAAAGEEAAKTPTAATATPAAATTPVAKTPAKAPAKKA